MAKSVTLEALRTDALTRADMAASSFVQVQEATRYINAAYTKYYDELIKSDAYYNVAQQPITTCLSTDPAAVLVNGIQQQDTYRLPANFYETKGLDINLGNGAQLATGRRVNWHDRNLYKFWGTTGWFPGQLILYYLRDAFMVYVPIPSGPVQVTHWYYPTAQVLANDTDCIDVLNGGDEFIVLYAAMQMARKEESWELYGALKGDFADEMQRVRDMAPNRDAAEPPKVTETTRRSGWRAFHGRVW